MARSTALPPAQKWTLKAVQTISGDDIGRMIRFFTWDAQRQMSTVVTAELRQVSHVEGRTSLTYGYGAEREESFEEGEVVSFDPPFSCADIVELRQALCDFHGITDDLP
ncbi:hypothetical protein I5G58_gp065 [Mycobacterium phage BirdsNest]|uniref:Uncharacterized protein n=1 Tax=Mycobacterium phage BirdsNest TaxID=2686231 RepID=A0A6B9L6Q3_9CAUD|nr:hypothetical protein I5G58_gp065 [Mycobacterium phage BirdsNest]QHB37367.1 hypothetical protein PBI_BIRDSNEST_65 [Mycobacterium phage BirdsNest]